MPQTQVVFYRELDGTVPVRLWLEELQQRDRKAFARCVERLQRLSALGYELRRPHADMLRDGIYELRIRKGSVNYRILYFFHGRNVAVLAHATTKEAEIPPIEIERALKRKREVEESPSTHIHEEPDDHGQ